jgi:hypothetical protein
MLLRNRRVPFDWKTHISIVILVKMCIQAIVTLINSLFDAFCMLNGVGNCSNVHCCLGLTIALRI